jgi:hypothetical protein
MLEELIDTPVEYGVEVDVRSDGGDLIVAHDPFVSGEKFVNWIQHYKHGTLIINTKEEGLEQRILNALKPQGISDFFFLDQSFPFLLKTAKAGERRCAVRVSEYESIDTAFALSGLVDWVWLDTFNNFKLDGIQARKLKAAGFKLCLVSPELQGRWYDKEIDEIKKILNSEGYQFDAVCTKTPERWK